MSYTTPTTSLRPKARPLTESLRPNPRPSERGLAAREEPEQPQQETEETGFWDYFDFFGGSTPEDDSTSASERASRLYEGDGYSPAFVGPIRPSEPEPEPEPGPSWLRNPFEDLFSDVVAPTEITAVDSVPVTEDAPVETATPVEVGTDTGAGLMSPPAEETETTNTDFFATIVTSAGSQDVDTTVPLTSGFDSLVEAEGTDIHLDGRGFVTLPYGIVPDSGSVKKANGTTFDPTGSHGLSASQLSGVDYSGATKFGISRTDYDSDEAFSKAVYAEFGNRTATSYGDGFADLTDEAKQAAYDMAWNAGIGSAGWSSVQTMLTEASKDGDKSKDSLIGFTNNFRSGTDYPRGLLKRRLQTYNLVANAGEEASVITTTAVMKGGKRTGTTYTVKDANGGLLKTWTKPDLDETLGDLEVPQ